MCGIINREMSDEIPASQLNQERNDLLNSSHLSSIEIDQLIRENKELKIKLEDEFRKNNLLENQIKESLEQNSLLNREIRKYKDENEENILTITDLKSTVHVFKVKHTEHLAMIHRLEQKVNEKNFSMKNDFETTISNQEGIIATLEEKIQLLENDIRVKEQKYQKEIEHYRVDTMNAWIQLQVRSFFTLRSFYFSRPYSRKQETNEKKTKMIQELHTLRTSESLLVQQNNFYTNQINELENKLSRLQQDYSDQAIECKEAIDFISKQKAEIQVLRNETKENYQTKQMIQNELKLFKLQYEKLERAFVDSIEKFMNPKITIDEREERPR
jgi:hypothetical protein